MVVLIPSRRVDGALVFKMCVYGPSESGRKTVIEGLYENDEKKGLDEIKDEKSNNKLTTLPESIGNLKSRIRNFLTIRWSIIFYQFFS